LAQSTLVQDSLAQAQQGKPFACSLVLRE